MNLVISVIEVERVTTIKTENNLVTDFADVASVAALWRPAISALNTSVCSPKAPLLSKTFLPWLYPTTPNPAVHFPFLSDRDPSEYMSRTSLFSSSSVMNSRWTSAHSSFTDSLGRFLGVKIFILSSRLTLDGLHGGSAFRVIHSISSNILWLTCVMHVMYLAFGFVLYLLDSSKGGSGGGVASCGWALWSG